MRRVDDAAGGVPKFGVEVAALQREFLDGIGRRHDGGVGPGIVAAIDLDIVVNAVQAEIVLPFVDAIHPEISRLRAACVGGAVPASTGSGRISIDAGGKLRQRTPVAGGKRHIVHGLVGDGLADLGVFRFKQRGRSGYRDALLHVASHEMNVDGQDLLHVHEHVVHDVLLEAARLGFNHVFARNHVGEYIRACRGGFGCGFDAGVVIRQQNSCVLHHCAGWVFDRSCDLPAIELSG